MPEGEGARGESAPGQRKTPTARPWFRCPRGKGLRRSFWEGGRETSEEGPAAVVAVAGGGG